MTDEDALMVCTIQIAKGMVRKGSRPSRLGPSLYDGKMILIDLEDGIEPIPVIVRELDGRESHLCNADELQESIANKYNSKDIKLLSEKSLLERKYRIWGGVEEYKKLFWYLEEVKNMQKVDTICNYCGSRMANLHSEVCSKCGNNDDRKG